MRKWKVGDVLVLELRPGMKPNMMGGGSETSPQTEGGPSNDWHKPIPYRVKSTDPTPQKVLGFLILH